MPNSTCPVLETVTFGFFEAGNSTDKFCTAGPEYDPEDPNCAKLHVTGDLEVSPCPSFSAFLELHPCAPTSLLAPSDATVEHCMNFTVGYLRGVVCGWCTHGCRLLWKQT